MKGSPEKGASRKRIEEASLNSWPALRQMLYDGWVLRFSKGYTKRANSVNPLSASSINVDEKIRVCEALYAAQGLPSIFRITPFASPSDLDRVLARRRYIKVDPTLVMYKSLRRKVPPDSSVRLQDEQIDDWINIFCRLSESPVDKHATHKEILRAIPPKRILATLAVSGQVVACGLGVLESNYLGLFDLVTDPQQRNKGHGTTFVPNLLRWGQDNGASYAYLQVTENNAPARHLYTKLGFRYSYRYWYRVPGNIAR